MFGLFKIYCSVIIFFDFFLGKKLMVWVRIGDLFYFFMVRVEKYSFLIEEKILKG